MNNSLKFYLDTRMTTLDIKVKEYLRKKGKKETNINNIKASNIYLAPVLPT